MNQPITTFANQGELDACLAEWQERLFLSDWIIQAHLVDSQKDMALDDCEGEAVTTPTVKVGIIRILRERPEDSDGYPEKMCHEKILVHELLHHVFPTAEQSRDFRTYEGVQYGLVYHQNIERMAKSLIMAKYGVPFSWFKNS